MPHYEFFCHHCKKHFAKILSLVDYEEGDVLCPLCGQQRSRTVLVCLHRHHVEESA